MMKKDKLAFFDRIQLAKDIVINVKNDFKILMQRNKDKDDQKEALLDAFLAGCTVDVAIELGKLQGVILEAEKKLAEHLEKQKGE